MSLNYVQIFRFPLDLGNLLKYGPVSYDPYRYTAEILRQAEPPDGDIGPLKPLGRFHG